MGSTVFSLSSLMVLRAFLEDPDRELYGRELIRTTGVKAGSLYPILERFESEGHVVGRWEDIDEASEGRRRRRYYRLTEAGRDMATELLSSLATLLTPPVRRL